MKPSTEIDDMTPFYSPDNYFFSEEEISELLYAKTETEFLEILELIKTVNGKSDIDLFKSLMLVGSLN